MSLASVGKGETVSHGTWDEGRKKRMEPKLSSPCALGYAVLCVVWFQRIFSQPSCGGVLFLIPTGLGAICSR